MRVHLSRALSGPKLAMFQVSGVARLIKWGGLVEAGKAKEKPLDHQTEKLQK